MKLEALFNFRDCGIFSDFTLAFESDLSLVRGMAGPKFGCCIFAVVGATIDAGPKFGFSLTSGSDSSVFIRRRRSDDRFVTVTGI